MDVRADVGSVDEAGDRRRIDVLLVAEALGLSKQRRQVGVIREAREVLEEVSCLDAHMSEEGRSPEMRSPMEGVQDGQARRRHPPGSPEDGIAALLEVRCLVLGEVLRLGGAPRTGRKVLAGQVGEDDALEEKVDEWQVAPEARLVDADLTEVLLQVDARGGEVVEDLLNEAFTRIRVQELKIMGRESVIQKTHDVHAAGHDEGRRPPFERLEDKPMIISHGDALAQYDEPEVLFCHQTKKPVLVFQRRALLEDDEVVDGGTFGAGAGGVEDQTIAADDVQGRRICWTN